MKELAPRPAMPAVPEWVYVVVIVLAVAPSTFLVWLFAAGAVYAGRVRRWQLAVAAPVTALPLVAIEPATALRWALNSYDPLGASQGPRGGWSLAFTLLLVLVRLLVVSLPVGLPLGLAAAAVKTPQGEATITDPKSPRVRAVRADARARRQRVVAKVITPARNPAAEALGESRGGDLKTWQRSGYVIPPADHFGQTTILVGASGTGKSTTIERIAYLAGRERRELCLIDGKGTDGLDQAVTAAYLTGWPDARVACFPQQPVDLWRGTPQQLANRLAAAWQFSDEAEFYEQAAMLGLRLALTQPGPPCASMLELVRRLDPAALVSAWAGHPAEVSVIRGMERRKRLSDIALRASNLAAALAGRWDGGWWLGDVDLACFTVPTMDNPKDADAAMRVLLAAYGQYLVTDPGRPRLLAFDEFSALAGGRPYAISLVERSRSSGSGVILGAQSAAGLGEPRDRERLLASANAVILFRSPIPAELAMLAGTQDALTVTRSTGLHDERIAVTERHVGKVDQQEIREAETGVGEVISRGRKVKVSLTKIDAATRDAARGLTAPPIAGTLHPSTPGRAVAHREIPVPPAPPQGQAPMGSPPASLDPPPAPQVRRYRPPGSGGEAAPPADRDNQEVRP